MLADCNLDHSLGAWFLDRRWCFVLSAACKPPLTYCSSVLLAASSPHTLSACLTATMPACPIRHPAGTQVRRSTRGCKTLPTQHNRKAAMP